MFKAQGYDYLLLMHMGEIQEHRHKNILHKSHLKFRENPFHLIYESHLDYDRLKDLLAMFQSAHCVLRCT